MNDLNDSKDILKTTDTNEMEGTNEIEGDITHKPTPEALHTYNIEPKLEASHTYAPESPHAYTPETPHTYAPEPSHAYTPETPHAYAPEPSHAYALESPRTYAPESSHAYGYRPAPPVPHIHTTPHTPPPRKSGFLRKLTTVTLSIAVGAMFLGLGIGAGYVTMLHLLPDTPVHEVQPRNDFTTITQEPILVTIDPSIPDFTDTIAEVKDSVVSINVTAIVSGGGFFPSFEQPGAGSGFIFDYDDEYVFIATNHHVIAEASSITISLDDNERVDAVVIGSHVDTDLAVLAVSKEDLLEKGVPYTIAQLGCSDSMRMGDTVVAIGNAMGAGQTVTKGIISAVDLQITIQNQQNNTVLTLDVLQTDAAVNHGNSGGPLINQDGEVIGIVTAKLFGQGIEGMGYVLPINDVRTLLEDLKEVGIERHAFIGLLTRPINEDIRDLFSLPATGMLVMEVIVDGPADVAGIVPWDLIVSIDDQIITDFDVYAAALGAAYAGDEIRVGIYRNSEYMEILVVLGSIVR